MQKQIDGEDPLRRLFNAKDSHRVIGPQIQLTSLSFFKLNQDNIKLNTVSF